MQTMNKQILNSLIDLELNQKFGSKSMLDRMDDNVRIKNYILPVVLYGSVTPRKECKLMMFQKRALRINL